MGKERINMVVKMNTTLYLQNFLSKYSKKIIILFMMITCLIFLVGCDYEVNLYNENVRNGLEIIKIELVEYNLDFDYANNEMEKFEVNHIEVIDTLNNDLIDSFLEELSTIGGITSKPKNPIKSPCGIGVILTYEDEGVTILTVIEDCDDLIMYIGDYDQNLNLEYYESFIWAEVTDSFKDIISNYFEYNI